MEIIVLILGEMIFALLAPLFMIIAELMLAAVAALLGLVGVAIPKGRRRGSSGRLTRPPMSPGAKRALKIAASVAIVISLTTAGSLWILNRFYFSESVEFVFSTLEKRTGISTTCRQASGSVWKGKIRLEDCQTARKQHPNTRFELDIESLAFDLNVTSLFGEAQVKSATIVGVSGWLERQHPQEDESTDRKTVIKPRRSFNADELLIRDLRIALSGKNRDGKAFAFDIRVDSLSSKPLRSRLALFDVLFRSNASGEIAGAPFSIKTDQYAGGRTTQWRADRLPVARLGSIAGGALAWFSRGEVDIVVDDSWGVRQRDNPLQLTIGEDYGFTFNSKVSIDMDWNLNFRDIEVAAPAGTGMMAKLVSKPLARYVNSHSGVFPMRFSLIINEDQFEYSQSLAAAGFWPALSDAIGAYFRNLGVELRPLSNQEKDLLKKGSKMLIDRLRGADEVDEQE